MHIFFTPSRPVSDTAVLHLLRVKIVLRLSYAWELRIQWRLIFASVIRWSRVRLWVVYFIYFKFTPVFFYWMFFNSIKEINRLRKERNKLLSKGMLNIYLKATTEKNWPSQNFDFLSLNNLSPGQFLRSSNLHRYHWILRLLGATYKSEVWSQTVCGFSIILILKGIMAF